MTELDEHLRFLEPLIGHTWEGGYVGREAPDLVILLHFDPVVSGKAVKYTREAAELDFLSETHFYWSPDREEVRFITFDSRGNVSDGVVTVQDGRIVLNGEYHRPEGAQEYRTEWVLDSEGVLTDTFTRKENGEWVPGHVQEFTSGR
jgi:hypothetical protein